MGRVWVVGSLNVDRGWRVERHPVVGETILGSMLPAAPGGKGLNQAVAAARMEAAVTLVGCVGDDADGRWLVEVARDEGVDIAAVTTSTDASTGTALIVIAADGSNTVTVDAGANARLVIGPGALGIAADDVVLAQLEVPVDAVRRAFVEARSVGATSILNPSPLGSGSELVPEADVVIVNEIEAEQVDVRVDQLLVVTLGSAGVRARVDGSEVEVPGIAVEPIDTTGAGDCFAGVLAAGLAAGRSLADSLDQANRAATISVTRLGTVASMPTAEELAIGAS